MKVEKSESTRGHVWTGADFENLGWSGCRLYAVAFPDVTRPLVLYLDYVLAGPPANERADYLIVPAKLSFDCLGNGLRFDLDFDVRTDIDLVAITRANERPTPNGKMNFHDYKIETDAGFIYVTAASFRQEVVADARASAESHLGRGHEFA